MASDYNSLMRYLPEYYEGIKEFDIITGIEGDDVQQLKIALINVWNNQFIETSDLGVVKKWERLLKISNNSNNLEYRKSVILLKLSTKSPLTYIWLLRNYQVFLAKVILKRI